MTPDEMIEVLEAYKDGKQIQYKEFFNQKNWRDTENPSWDFTHADYRVKPEPREFYIWPSRENLDRFEGYETTQLLYSEKVIKVREVLE